ncbi:hypothetical protein K502DRAFT_213276 [Neoconidiobolus thromboides FSU 785]|nr:hypothetical protein K502DRAFT_213276 [Neoconidiobolus thromboides FSU 785]
MLIISEIITALGVVLILFLTLFCIACGVVKASELIEEYTLLSKKIIVYLSYIIILFHILLCLFDGYPLIPTIVGLISQLIYLNNQTSFPLLSPTSIKFVLLIVTCIVNHFVWFFYFLNLPHIYNANLEFLAFFILIIWSVPIAYFLALQSPSDMLPTNNADNNNDNRRSGLLKNMLPNFFKMSTLPINKTN